MEGERPREPGDRRKPLFRNVWYWVTRPGKPDVRTTTATDDVNLLVSGLPMAAHLEYDFYTDDRMARGRVEWNRSQAATMRTALHDAQGAVVKNSGKEWTVAGPGEAEQFLPLTGLKDGVYEWRVTATVTGAAPVEAKDRLIKLASSTVEVRANRFTRGIEINRTPFFPVFLPQMPGSLGNADMALYKAQGFNCMANGVISLSATDILKNGLSPEKLKTLRGHLDRLDAAGLKFIFVFWGMPDLFEAHELRGNIGNFIKVNTTVVNALKDHPAIIAWYLLDEMDTRWEETFGYREADIEALRDAVRAADPYRPAYINFNHLWKTEPFGKLQATDIISLDQYPFGEPIAMDLDKLVPAPRQINDLSRGRQPSFIWIHGSYGPPEIPREPRPYEMRVQGWLYLVYGTRGLGYWSGRPLNPELWQEHQDLNRACVFLSENAFGPPTARPLKQAVQKERIHYAVWVNGAKGYVFGVSTADTPLAFAIVPERLFQRPVKAVRRLFEDGQVGIAADGILKDVFPPAQRRAYEFDLR